MCLSGFRVVSVLCDAHRRRNPDELRRVFIRLSVIFLIVGVIDASFFAAYMSGSLDANAGSDGFWRSGWLILGGATILCGIVGLAISLPKTSSLIMDNLLRSAGVVPSSAGRSAASQPEGRTVLAINTAGLSDSEARDIGRSFDVRSRRWLVLFFPFLLFARYALWIRMELHLLSVSDSNKKNVPFTAHLVNYIFMAIVALVLLLFVTLCVQYFRVLTAYAPQRRRGGYLSVAANDDSDEFCGDIGDGLGRGPTPVAVDTL